MKWPTVPLVKLCQIETGRTPSRAHPEYFGGDNVWVTIADLNDETVSESKEHVTDNAVAKARMRPVPAGTVLLSYKLSLGKLGIAGTSLFTNEAIAALPPRPGIDLVSKYLFYALKTVDYLALCHGAVKGKCLNRASLNRIPVPYPPLSEQRRIVEILDQADALRKKRAEADAKAARILPALFYKMFGDPATNPKGWEQKPFDLVFKDRTARFPKLQKNEYQPAGRFPVVDQGKELIAGYCDDESLVTRVGFPVIVFGDHTRIVKYVDFPFVAGADGSRVFVSKEGFVPAFLATQLELHRIPNLGYSRHMRVVRRLKFLAPPTSLQEAYAKQAMSIRPLLNAQGVCHSRLDRIWQCLLHRAFTGDLTAKWREAHMKELLSEMEQQAKALETPVIEKRVTKVKSKRHAGRRAKKAEEKQP
ncbi:MAG: hypothetical protein DRH43_07015 [Deltaproteobacteria bacterium]|nr:MAG: hypothetical protein DRH43_07015 [Deltaproteobacteria bacterium]